MYANFDFGHLLLFLIGVVFAVFMSLSFWKASDMRTVEECKTLGATIIENEAFRCEPLEQEHSDE